MYSSLCLLVCLWCLPEFFVVDEIFCFDLSPGTSPALPVSSHLKIKVYIFFFLHFLATEESNLPDNCYQNFLLNIIGKAYFANINITNRKLNKNAEKYGIVTKFHLGNRYTPWSTGFWISDGTLSTFLVAQPVRTLAALPTLGKFPQKS